MFFTYKKGDKTSERIAKLEAEVEALKSQLNVRTQLTVYRHDDRYGAGVWLPDPYRHARPEERYTTLMLTTAVERILEHIGLKFEYTPPTTRGGHVDLVSSKITTLKE